MHLLFVTPPLDGPATGGTLFNRQLLAALTAQGIAFEHRALDSLRLELPAAQPRATARQPSAAGISSATDPAQSSLWTAPATNSAHAADPHQLEEHTAIANAIERARPTESHGAAERMESASGNERARSTESHVAADRVESVSGDERARSTESHGAPERTGMASGLECAGATTLPRWGAGRAHDALRGACPDQVWVDSLYLSELPDLRARIESRKRVGLLLHYLPSLLGNPLLRTAAELSEAERRALHAADTIITPSEYLKQLVEQICPGKRCACVTPGVQVSQPGGASARDGSALMVCNITENKGVLPFLRELAATVAPAATFTLAIAGDQPLEAAYAGECVTLCEQHPWLREHVRFLGSVPQAELFTRLAHASVLVSASRMESYGMALAEARALGTPILALPGGNIAHHVAADSGGQLAGAPRELAHALCALMADPAEQASRLARARAAARSRPWSAAAADFVASAVEASER